MTNEIKRILRNLFEVTQRMIIREAPMISRAVNIINAWLMGIEYRAMRKRDKAEQAAYDHKKVDELRDALAHIQESEDETNEYKPTL